MRLTRIQLRNYRNYVNLDLEIANHLNIFLGENAQGKTNLIEAVYYGALGRSHRTRTDSELIRWRQNGGVITLHFCRMEIENCLQFTFKAAQGKEILYNGGVIKPKELLGTLNVVLFAPEDLLLVKGAPAGRRHFLDGEIAQASPVYDQKLTQYNRIVAQRNGLLRRVRERKAPQSLLDNWDEQLASAASALVVRRQEAVKKLAMLSNLMHRKITGSRESLSIAYKIAGAPPQPPDKLEDWYRERLAALRGEDILHGSTGVGPHRDDLLFYVNNVHLRAFGSQGQQRTAILSLKLAELEFLKSETGEYPLLLLDDVMSELDRTRREHLLLFIRDRVQTFITATDQNDFPSRHRGKYYYVEQGTVRG